MGAVHFSYLWLFSCLCRGWISYTASFKCSSFFILFFLLSSFLSMSWLSLFSLSSGCMVLECCRPESILLYQGKNGITAIYPHTGVRQTPVRSSRAYVSVWMSVCLSVSLSLCLSVCLSVWSSASLYYDHSARPVVTLSACSRYIYIRVSKYKL